MVSSLENSQKVRIVTASGTQNFEDAFAFLVGLENNLEISQRDTKIATVASRTRQLRQIRFLGRA